jgi:hypothetical protein
MVVLVTMLVMIVVMVMLIVMERIRVWTLMEGEFIAVGAGDMVLCGCLRF